MTTDLSLPVVQGTNGAELHLQTSDVALAGNSYSVAVLAELPSGQCAVVEIAINILAPACTVEPIEMEWLSPADRTSVDTGDPDSKEGYYEIGAPEVFFDAFRYRSPAPPACPVELRYEPKIDGVNVWVDDPAFPSPPPGQAPMLQQHVVAMTPDPNPGYTVVAITVYTEDLSLDSWEKGGWTGY